MMSGVIPIVTSDNPSKNCDVDDTVKEKWANVINSVHLHFFEARARLEGGVEFPPRVSRLIEHAAAFVASDMDPPPPPHPQPILPSPSLPPPPTDPTVQGLSSVEVLPPSLPSPSLMIPEQDPTTSNPVLSGEDGGEMREQEEPMDEEEPRDEEEPMDQEGPMGQVEPNEEGKLILNEDSSHFN